MRQIKAYLSHSIMGKMGSSATEEYIKSNNRKAVVMGKNIRGCFPEIDLHVPAECEAFVHRAYKMGHLTIDQILDIDCDIVDGVDLLLVFNHENHISHGMKVEMDHAKEHNIPVVEFSEMNLEVIDEILKFLRGK